MEVNSDFWRGRRIFITGHSGFKGGWLSLWLKHLGARVAGYSLPPSTNPSLFEVARVASQMDSAFGDIRDFDRLAAELRRGDPEVVFHLAAQPLVRRSYADPRESYETNVMGTVNVLEAVRRVNSVRAVVVITSDKCYENREWVWGYREEDPMGGHDPYSSSKGCAELVTAAYRRSFFDASGKSRHGAALATARAGNVIGGGDWSPDRIVPDFLRSVEAGQPLQIRNPEAIRPWQHVLEPLAGYLMLAQRLVESGPAFAKAWNFGPPDEDAHPVSHLVETLSAQWGGMTQWRIDDGPHPHEASYLKLDSSRARSELGWRTRYRLGDALAALVDWHKAHLEGTDMAQYSIRQIDSYTSS